MQEIEVKEAMAAVALFASFTFFAFFTLIRTEGIDLLSNPLSRELRLDLDRLTASTLLQIVSPAP
jgi:hypothetical protein